MTPRVVAVVSVSAFVLTALAALGMAESKLSEQLGTNGPGGYATVNKHDVPQQGTGVETLEESAGLSTREDLELWKRESWFIDLNNYLRQGMGPSLRKQTGNSENQTGSKERPVRILAVGDSFLYGMGVSDLDTLWPRQLERKLNETYGDGTFAVDILARTGASFMEEAEWLTPERLQELSPDLILFGYVLNDPMPSFRESSVCSTKETCKIGAVETHPQFRECLAGDSGPISGLLNSALSPVFPAVADWALRRYCDPEKFSAELGVASEDSVTSNPKASPYWPYFIEALNLVKERTSGTPVAFVQTTVTGLDKVSDVLTAYGFTVLTVQPQDLELYQALPLSASRANPVDWHHGPGISAIIAERLAQEIEGLIDQEAISKAAATPRQQARPIVSSFLPAWLTVESGTDNATITKAGTDPAPPEVANLYAQVKGPGQFASCLPLGRPHARVMLDPYRIGLPLRITSASGAEIEVISVGYSPNGEPWYEPEGTIAAGDELILPEKPLRTGLLLAQGTRAQCGPESVASLSEFSIALSFENN